MVNSFAEVIGLMAIIASLAPLFPPLKNIFKIKEDVALLYIYIGMAGLYLIFTQTFSASSRLLHVALVCLYIVTGAIVTLKSNLARYFLVVIGLLLIGCFLIN